MSDEPVEAGPAFRRIQAAQGRQEVSADNRDGRDLHGVLALAAVISAYLAVRIRAG